VEIFDFGIRKLVSELSYGVVCVILEPSWYNSTWEVEMDKKTDG